MTAALFDHSDADTRAHMPRLRLAPPARVDSTGIVRGDGGQPYYSAGRVYHELRARGVDAETTDQIIGALMHAAYEAGVA